MNAQMKQRAGMLVAGVLAADGLVHLIIYTPVCLVLGAAALAAASFPRLHQTGRM